MARIYELIGRDLTELTTASNTETTSELNIWEQGSIRNSLGVKTTAFSPIKSNTLDKFSLFCKRISTLNLSGGDVRRQFLQIDETMFYETSSNEYAYFGWIDTGIVDVENEAEGAANEGLQYGGSLHWVGSKQFVTVTFDNDNNPVVNELTNYDTSLIRDLEGEAGRRHLKLFFIYDENEFAEPIARPTV